MKKYILSLFILMAFQARTNAQGCVAIRTVGGLNTMEHAMHNMMMHDSTSKKIEAPKWDLNISARYFKSYRHYNGTTEVTQRVSEETDVRNFSRAMDISLVRRINEQWSVGINLPLAYNERTSLYEDFLPTHKGLGIYVSLPINGLLPQRQVTKEIYWQGLVLNCPLVIIKHPMFFIIP
jgi:hypothetical protein